MEEEGVWIFGYGSLVWKPNIPYTESRVGYIKGHMRRFWQGSTDHRGIPGAPGRVVTLIENNEEVTWGVAYKIHLSEAPEAIVKLNHRERGGYITKKLQVYPVKNGTGPIPVLVYIALDNNSNYLGPAPVKEIAQQVIKSNGPSGPNTEYVLKLAEWMRNTLPKVNDNHLFEVESEILDLLKS